jgi:hypothetical protein
LEDWILSKYYPGGFPQDVQFKFKKKIKKNVLQKVFCIPRGVFALFICTNSGGGGLDGYGGRTNLLVKVGQVEVLVSELLSLSKANTIDN